MGLWTILNGISEIFYEELEITNAGERPKFTWILRQDSGFWLFRS